MPHDSPALRTRLLKGDLGALTLALSMAAATSASAQSEHRFALSGQVSPRCWAAGTTMSELTGSPTAPASRCNQRSLTLSVTTRAAPLASRPGPQPQMASVAVTVTPRL